MKSYSNHKHGPYAIRAFLLIYSITFVSGVFKCPNTISDECNCKEFSNNSHNYSDKCVKQMFEPDTFLSCAKNDKKIIMHAGKYTSCPRYIRNYLDIKCINEHSNSALEKLLKFEENPTKFEIGSIKMDGCSQSVHTFVKDTFFKYINSEMSFRFETNDHNVPDNLFENVTELTSLEFVGSSEDKHRKDYFICASSLYPDNCHSHVIGNNDVHFHAIPKTMFRNLKKLENLTIAKTYPSSEERNQEDPIKTGLLQTIELYLGILPADTFNGLNHLKYLCLEGNYITTLPHNVFHGLSNITHLKFRKNLIFALPENIFDGLTKLSELSLDKNGLNYLPEHIFKSLIDLEAMDLSRNKLKTLPENVFKSLTKLKKLNLDKNQLNFLPENLFADLIHLEDLNLRGNKLKTLSSRLFNNLRNLKILKLRKNKLKTLPEDIFHGLTELNILKLDQNKLKTLNASLFHKSIHLEEILLEKNGLTTLPADIFKNLTKLRYLNLHKNKLKTLSPNIFEHQLSNDLFKVDFGRNDWVCDCNFLDIFEPFQDRNLSKKMTPKCSDRQWAHKKLAQPRITIVTNKLDVPDHYKQRFISTDAIICPTNSTNETAQFCPSECNCMIINQKMGIIFDCSNSNLTDIPSGLGNGFDLMPKLQEIVLDLRNNSIERLPNSTMHGFQLVTKILASNNSIKSIDVDNLPAKLNDIDLSGNKLESLSSAVIQHFLQDSVFNTTKKLVFEGNPWTCDKSFLKFVDIYARHIGTGGPTVDYRNIVCNDGEFLYQKLDQIAVHDANDV